MPPLKEMLGESLTGFSAANNPRPSPPAELPGKTLGGNPYRRCPLPPMAATVDTLRQFDESGKVPTHRVIPLPLQTSSSGGSVTNVTNVTSLPSSSSTSVSTSQVSASVSLSVPALAPGQSFTATLTIAKSFQLRLLTATNPVEARLYSTAVAQSGDLPRATDTPPPFEVTSDIITDVVFDSPPYQWSWQNRVAANADNPQTSSLYITVINPTTTGLGATSITVTFLPLEK